MKFSKKVLFLDIVPTFFIAFLIIFFAVAGNQSFIKTLPTLITLIVQIMLIRANRFAFLLGGLNAMLYGISYYNEALYFSLFSAVLISAPLQFISFATWTKHRENGVITLRFTSRKNRALIGIAIVLSWIVLWKTCSSCFFESRFAVLDSLAFVAGLAALVLSVMRLIESRYINLISCTAALIMWIAVSIENPKNINFVIISIYDLFRVAQAAVTWTKLTNQGGERNEN